MRFLGLEKGMDVPPVERADIPVREVFDAVRGAVIDVILKRTNY
jgi:hypothetical protein